MPVLYCVNENVNRQHRLFTADCIGYTDRWETVLLLNIGRLFPLNVFFMVRLGLLNADSKESIGRGLMCQSDICCVHCVANV